MRLLHYSDDIISAVASQITSMTIVDSTRDCLLNRISRRKSKKTSKLRVIGLCKGNSPVTGEFPAQRTSNAENVFHLMTPSCYWESVTLTGAQHSIGTFLLLVTRLSALDSLYVLSTRELICSTRIAGPVYVTWRDIRGHNNWNGRLACALNYTGEESAQKVRSQRASNVDLVIFFNVTSLN